MTAACAEFSPNKFTTGSLDDIRRGQLANRMSVMTSAGMGLTTVIFLLTVLSYPFWQLFVLTIVFALGFLNTLFCAVYNKFNNPQSKVLWLAPAVTVPLVLLASAVQNLALPIALISFLFGTILSSGSLVGRSRDFGISLSFFTALVTSVVGASSPIPQVRIPLLEIYIPSVLGVVLMVYVVLLLMEYVTATLRIKLMTISLAMAIVPLILLSLIDSRFIQNSLQKQTDQALRLAAEETASSVDSFLGSIRELVEREATLDVFSTYLAMSPEDRSGSSQEETVAYTLGSLVTPQYNYLRSIGLLDMDGTVIYDTNPTQIGKVEGLQNYFSMTVSTGQSQVSSVVFSEDGKDAFLYFTSPVRDTRQRQLGVIRMQFDALVLQNLLEEKVNLVGARSHPILLDENYLRLADTLIPNDIYRLLVPLPSTTISQLFREGRLPNIPIYQMSTGHNALVPIIEDYLTNPFFSLDFHGEKSGHLESGAMTRLTSKPWFLVFVREQTSLTALVKSQGKLSTLIATLIAGIVGVFASGVSSALSKPIVRLHSTAEQIISGDLEAQAEVESSDEIGSLASAFNNMTYQLKTLINDLETRVLERTKELANQNEVLIFRGRQLQTVSDVARGIISTQEFEGLLARVTTLVSERFNFYHVGVFLLDQEGEYAMLRASNSEGGQRMLARQHKLKVGAVGIVGNVTATGQPRIATDVGTDAVYFNNPDLPLTRSEMALPLIANQRVIGALDVQSTKPNAFSQEDIELFSTLADQISIAIVNNKLFNETVKALEESQRIHRQYLRREWGADIAGRQKRAFKYTPQGVNAQPEISLPEIQEALATGQPVLQPADGPAKTAVLAVPIKLRGETLGVIHLKDSGADRTWNDDEVLSISAVADQVALALENARLLEKTMRRAERDRKALEITGKIRSSTDPRSMVEIALQELQQTLKASKAYIVLKGEDSNEQVDAQKAHQTESTRQVIEGSREV